MPDTSIAIPDSCLKGDKTQLDKSRKVSAIARAAAVFGVQSVMVYEDGASSSDRRLLVTVLRYLETPPYLRRRLFPKEVALKYAGVLHPLNIAGHQASPDPSKIKAGDARDGVVISQRSMKFIDIGTAKPLPYHGKEEIGRRVTILFASGHPDMRHSEITGEQSPHYTGYRTRQRGKLTSVLSSWEGKIILTSRKGRVPGPGMLKEYQAQHPLLLVFGSTDRGLHDMLGARIRSVQHSRILNFFPDQHTGTVRMEEAVLGTLAILNMGQTLYRCGP